MSFHLFLLHQWNKRNERIEWSLVRLIERRNEEMWLKSSLWVNERNGMWVSWLMELICWINEINQWTAMKWSERTPHQGAQRPAASQQQLQFNSLCEGVEWNCWRRKGWAVLFVVGYERRELRHAPQQERQAQPNNPSFTLSLFPRWLLGFPSFASLLFSITNQQRKLTPAKTRMNQ